MNCRFKHIEKEVNQIPSISLNRQSYSKDDIFENNNRCVFLKKRNDSAIPLQENKITIHLKYFKLNDPMDLLIQILLALSVHK